MTYEKGDLLSFADLHIVGKEFRWNVKKPTLREIANIGFNAFSWYVVLASMNMQTFLESYSSEQFKELYNSQPKEEQEKCSFFDIVRVDQILSGQYATVFSFFSRTPVVFEQGEFVQMTETGEPGGVIKTAEDFEAVQQTIRIVCCVDTKEKKKPEFAKNQSKIGQSIWEKLQKGKKQYQKAKKSDKKYELSNLISAVAVRSNGLNFINVWDYTIYQLYEEFNRLNDNIQFEISMRQVSVWGDKDRKFDPTVWFTYKDPDDVEDDML